MLSFGELVNRCLSAIGFAVVFCAAALWVVLHATGISLAEFEAWLRGL
jgi:hypothetical protein